MWHELLVTGDDAFAAAMWPVVRRAAGFVLGLQTDRGEIAWQRTADGTAASYALLTGSCRRLPGVALRDRAGGVRSASRSRTGSWRRACSARVVAGEPGAFPDKSRFSMDWYYPVLGGPVRGAGARTQRLAAGWATFVVPGLGVRCVSDEPWVTGAETSELALALDATGKTATGARPCSADVPAPACTRTARTGPAGSSSTERTTRPSAARGPRRR